MHVASLAAPAITEYFPALQSVQVAAPVLAEYFPTLQSVQVASLVAPVLAEYFPASQAVQGSTPTPPEVPGGGVGAKEPAGHEVQVSGSTRYFPAPHCAQSPRTEPPPLLVNM